MIDRLASFPERLAEVRNFIISTREETVQERENVLDSLWNHVLQEPVGSERYDAFYYAYYALKRQPERKIVTIFGKDTPIWLPNLQLK